MNLPEGWERHESKRYPGNFYYFNVYGVKGDS